MVKIADRKHKEKIADAKTALEKIDTAILNYLNEQDISSFKTEYGTAFKFMSDRVNIGDISSFKQHILSDLLMSLTPWKYVSSDGEWQPSVDGDGGGEELLKDDLSILMDSGGIGLLTIQANKTACKEFMKENDGVMPSGVNYTTFVDLKIRK